jgi:hypothetical protein
MDQARLGLGGGESGELDDLVETELATLQRARQRWQALERVRRSDPSSSLPFRDVVPHREPVGRVTCAPQLPVTIWLERRDGFEQRSLS